MFLIVLEDCLHLDHLLKAHNHLGWEPPLHTSLKVYIDVGASFELHLIAVVIRVVSCLCLSLVLLCTDFAHLLSHLNNAIKLLQSLLRVVRDAVHLALIDKFLFLVDVLQIDDSVSKDFDSALVVRETGVLPSNCRNHRQQVLALAHFNCKHSTPVAQLKCQFDQLVTLFPVHGVFAEDLVQVVEDFGDAFSLVLIIDLYKSEQRSLVSANDHEVVDSENLEHLLDVNM